MRNASHFALAAVLLSISCHGFGASRGLAVVLAMVAAGLALVAHRGHARAGGSTGSTGTGTGTGTADTGTGTIDTGTADATGTTAASTTGTGTGDGGLDTSAGATGHASGSSESGTTMDPFGTEACLSAPFDGSTDPTMTVCLCACETGNDREGADWAPALLVPLLAQRRRNRRQILERLGTEGRLPADVLARRRTRVDAEE